MATGRIVGPDLGRGLALLLIAVANAASWVAFAEPEGASGAYGIARQVVFDHRAATKQLGMVQTKLLGLAIGLAVGAVSILVCAIWAKIGHRGPLETVLRALDGRKREPVLT